MGGVLVGKTAQARWAHGQRGQDLGGEVSAHVQGHGALPRLYCATPRFLQVAWALMGWQVEACG